MPKLIKKLLCICLIATLVFSNKTNIYNSLTNAKASNTSKVKIVNNNNPKFTKKQKKNTKAFEKYSKLDKYGRCGVAFANICPELMPTEERGEIGQVKPSGWHTVKYPGVIDGLYLYNRCHLIAFCLAGENANEKNLITGTRQLNVDYMLPYEVKVAKYVEKTGNHVLYRVTPKYKGKNLVASGVQMEAYSVEDKGKGIKFNVYCPNIQDGIKINYKTGDSELSSNSKPSSTTQVSKNTYVLNTNSKKIHKPNCSAVKLMKANNKKTVNTSIDTLKKQGYTECQMCFH